MGITKRLRDPSVTRNKYAMKKFGRLLFMSPATSAALLTIIEALHTSGAIGDKVVRQVVEDLRDQKGTFGTDDDAQIASDLEYLA
ncbi:MAG: hypothetical protein ACLGHC_10070, partial [Alphaproteobacteria bacterium]